MPKKKSETDPRTTKHNTSGKSSGDHEQKNLSSDGSATYKPQKPQGDDRGDPKILRTKRSLSVQSTPVHNNKKLPVLKKTLIKLF